MKVSKILSILLLSVGVINAYDTTIIYHKDKPIFQLDFYNKGETTTFWGESSIQPFSLNKEWKDEIIRAAQFWANIIGENAQNSNPIPISIGTMEEENANAISYDVFSSPIFNRVLLGESIETIRNELLEGGLSLEDVKYLGHINMGTIDWYVAKHPSTLPQNGNQADTFSTFTHELFHALGLASLTHVNKQNETLFATSLNSFSNHLYDAKGTQAKSGMKIVSSQDEFDEAIKKGEKVFFVDRNSANLTDSFSNANGNAYFKGDNVLSVIKDAELGFDGINGLPVNGWEDDRLDMSHIELDNSLMSHQAWTNFLFYMEAELALLQDLGYNFDRKLYYGDSIYESDLPNWQSDHGYFARENNKWLEGKYNPTDYGVGLHIYGKNNTATQNHDILSSGIAASGIRVDGSNNQLTLSNGIKVHTLGDYSNALLVAYGKDHVINHNAELKASGKGGIGININFGDNEQIGGNSLAYRGSYMIGGSYYDLEDPDDIKDMLNLYNLDGALVKELNLSSSSVTLGNLASIYIADNAYVEKINIQKGAKIKGDIISSWNPNNDKLLSEYQGQFFTELNFGNASSTKPSFVKANKLSGLNNVDIEGNILGANSFKMNVNDGLNLQGSAFVYNLDNRANFKLLSTKTQNSMLYVKNDFSQNSSASLSVPLNGEGKVNVYVGNNANLGGNLFFYIGKDYYKSGTLTLDSANMISAGGVVSGSFSDIVYDPLLNAASNTLNFAYDSAKQELQIKRNYQPFAKTDTDISLSSALNALSFSGSKEDVAPLFSELDFMQDTKEISKALDSLNARVYLDSVKVSLDFQESLNRELLGLLHTDYNQEWQSSISTFGDYQNSKSNGDFNAYKGYNTGLKLGSTKSFNQLNLGFQAILNNNNIDINDILADTKTKGAYAGIFAKYSLEDFYLFLGLRGGYEHTKLNRAINIGSFNANYNSKFNSYLSSEILGIGKSFEYENFSITPLVYLEHNLLHRQSFSEENANATALNLASKNFNRLNSFIGVDLNYIQNLNANTLMNIAFLGGYNHSFLDSLKNSASFKGASASEFYAKNNLSTKDSLYLQGEIGFVFKEFIFSKMQFSSNIQKEADFKGKFEVGMKF